MHWCLIKGTCLHKFFFFEMWSFAHWKKSEYINLFGCCFYSSTWLLIMEKMGHLAASTRTHWRPCLQSAFKQTINTTKAMGEENGPFVSTGTFSFLKNSKMHQRINKRSPFLFGGERDSFGFYHFISDSLTTSQNRRIADFSKRTQFSLHFWAVKLVTAAVFALFPLWGCLNVLAVTR